MKIASHEGVNYTPALKAKEGDWTYENLDVWLTNPQAFAAGTTMAFPGIPDVKKRANVIAYLRSKADNPVPLPEAAPAAEKAAEAPAAPADAAPQQGEKTAADAPAAETPAAPAEAAPPAEGGAAEIVLHERDPSFRDQRGPRAFRVSFASDPGGVRVAIATIKIAAPLSELMVRDVVEWARGGAGCQARALRPVQPQSAAPAQKSEKAKAPRSSQR